MLYRNPRKVPTYYPAFIEAIRNTLETAFNSSDITTTRIFQELTQDKILRALRVKLEINYPQEEYPVRHKLAHTIARHFAIDCLRHIGGYARQTATKIISDYERQSKEEALKFWNSKFLSAKGEFLALYPKYIDSFLPRYRASRRKHLDAIRLLVFEGLGLEEVLTLLEAPSLATLWQWRHRGVKFVMEHPDTSENLADVLSYMKNSGGRKAETWPPEPDSQFFEDYDLGFPEF